MKILVIILWILIIALFVGLNILMYILWSTL